jgi:hypothetical protein
LWGCSAAKWRLPTLPLTDFPYTGLRADSLLRTSRLAVVNKSVFELELVTLSPRRLREAKERLAHWVVG